MKAQVKISTSELRALQSFHLRGYLGQCGSMKLADRRKLLHGLINKGLLTDTCQITSLGIEVSSPSYEQA